MLPERGLAGGIGGVRTEAPLVVTMTMEMHGGGVALGHSFIEDGLIGHEEVLDTSKFWTRVIDYATAACFLCLKHANMRLVCYGDVFLPRLPERGLAGGIGGVRTEAPLVVTMTMEMHGGGVALCLGASEVLVADGDAGQSKEAALPSGVRTIAMGHCSIFGFVGMVVVGQCMLVVVRRWSSGGWCGVGIGCEELI